MFYSDNYNTPMNSSCKESEKMKKISEEERPSSEAHEDQAINSSRNKKTSKAICKSQSKNPLSKTKLSQRWINPYI